jgi:hypothetical protein
MDKEEKIQQLKINEELEMLKMQRIQQWRWTTSRGSNS